MVVSFGEDGEVPWQLWGRWRRTKEQLEEWIISHTFREANFASDTVANFGCGLDNQSVTYRGRPPWLFNWEQPGFSFLQYLTFNSLNLNSTRYKVQMLPPEQYN
ncbi:hypothetical protein FRX31_014497 [Thalictrum thalictroides]|uniref:Uncharacterized protein n=1 Tax=Thalictrum thalictroides TaxID=46969 RepID=A0A7J6WEX3_THATH|nr:hypothetical protein FRX31_014497 [Thalictrum thalictroides]